MKGSQKDSEWEISLHKSSIKNTNKMERLRPERSVKDPGNTRIEEMSRGREERRRLPRGAKTQKEL
jgi:hypothetical protein